MRPLIDLDVLQDGAKRHHWLWYVCPTCKTGRSDPRGVRIARRADAWQAVERHFDLAWWAHVLAVLVARPGFLRDARDVGRVQHFAREWRAHLAAWPRARATPPHYAAFARAVRGLHAAAPSRACSAP